MQRVRHPFLHRAPGRHQRLAQDQPAEDALAPVVARAAPPEDVDIELLQIEQPQQFLECARHGRTG